MANATFAGLEASPGASAAVLASNTNPDGTTFTLNVSSSPGGAGIAVANILSGYQTFAATTAATTVITVPANRTWQGTITVSCSCAEAAAGAVQAQALGVVSTTGATATPAAGNYFAVQALAGANAATGLVGSQGANTGSTPFTVVAGTSAATIAVTVTIAGTTGRVDCSAAGSLVA